MLGLYFWPFLGKGDDLVAYLFILILSLDSVFCLCLLDMLLFQGQDDHLLKSPRCVRFLIKLLRPIASVASEDKAPKFGSKLLALRKNVGLLKNTTERLDSSSVAIFSRVQQILVNCKELKSTCQNDSGFERPELCPKWLALLTIEKACSSAISLDGIVKNINFHILYYNYYWVKIFFSSYILIDFLVWN